MALSLIFVMLLACKDTTKEVLDKNPEPTKIVVEAKSTFEDLERHPIELSDYKGKRVLLNFWATWCRPCIEEMPALLTAESALENENYVFLLASDQSLDKIKAFKENKGFDFNYLKFNGALADFQVSALPATFVYATTGELVDRIDGATDWDSPEIIQQLKNVQ